MDEIEGKEEMIVEKNVDAVIEVIAIWVGCGVMEGLVFVDGEATVEVLNGNGGLKYETLFRVVFVGVECAEINSMSTVIETILQGNIN